ncbi:putative nuclease HARBI1 [Acyrthosiphon pisum]|uniref:DDE Tnp4 domain-containing protein n=1 Tax=Acyrthosiphon pisum TaxID=7029 RepID=A0A8R2B681_ACYPI|nr:putative nuclease HARBI1 [Acyrthosiphon pisum]|eukprot:XP_008183345.1 PREDICTED: putative nuclease HARBI1 [Acyrthosiphon pisum]
MSRSQIKTMLICFFDIRGVVHKEFVPQGQPVTGVFYIEAFIHWLSRQECLVIEERFKSKGGISGVIGAIDGTHINVKAPLKQADSYTNRKLSKSMIVQAVCTEGKILTNISVGFPGRIHDARILVNSELYKQVTENGPSSLFYNKYHLLGDTAYPNREWLITPFKNYGNITRRKTKFNYLHAKTRVAIECAFGLLKGRWRRLLYLNKTKIENAPKVILTCCFLHNFCLVNNDTMSAVLTD